MTARILGIIGIVSPRINPVRRRMVFQVKHFNNPFPHRLPLKRLFHGHAFHVRSFRTVQSADYVSQFL
jgi:hypothetical protein